MYHQPPEIKALSSAAVLIDPKSFRGRGKGTTEDDKSKAAKRNEKKKRQR
jgi:hypothetical protein